MMFIVLIIIVMDHGLLISRITLKSVNMLIRQTFLLKETQEVAYVSSPPEVSWDDDGEGLVCTDMDAGVYFRPLVLYAFTRQVETLGSKMTLCTENLGCARK